MQDLLIAIQFLTRIRFSNKINYKPDSFAKSMVWFPVVGLILGGILIISNYLLSYLFPLAIVNIFILIILIYLTQGIHLDGFADFIDGFYASNEKQKILAVMRDSRVGSMGALGLIILFLTKYLALTNLTVTTKIYALLLAPVLSRWMMVFATVGSHYAREGDGLGKAFVENNNYKIFLESSLIPVILSITFFKLKSIFIIGMVFIITGILIRYIKKRIDGITGDTLGAINEIIEVAVLLFLQVGIK
ncbi:MAG: adenosylcobinamide-GDP ribazoletransferase [bacterium]